MASKLSQQGEIMIDHTNSPGITPEFMAKNGLNPADAVGAGVKWESGTKPCRHCGGLVHLHPLRMRDREWCAQCDCYICDNCALLRKLGAPHKPHQQLMGELFNATQKGRIL